MTEKKTDNAEKSVDEKVGKVQEAADIVLSKLLERMSATGDRSRIDELVEDSYDPVKYEKLLTEKARGRFDLDRRVESMKTLQKHPVGLAAWSCAAAKQQGESPELIIAKHLGVDGDSAPEQIYDALGIVAGPALEKTLQISTPDAGGVLTTGDRIDDFFRPLRDEAVVLSLGPVIRQIIDGAVTVTGLATDVSITWDNEVGTQDITSEPTWAERNRPTHFARVLVPISKKSLRSRASAQLLSDVEDSIRFAFAIGYDTEFINGTGITAAPKGLRAFAGTTTNSLGTSFTNIVDDAKGPMKRMAEASVPMRRLGWLMSQREKVELEFLRDTNDLFPFKAEIQNGTWFGSSIGATNQIATNEGGGDESFVLLVDFSGVLVGQGTELIITQYDQASYTQGGTSFNPVERGEIVIAAEAETTLLVAQSEFVEEVDQVRWGA